MRLRLAGLACAFSLVAFVALAGLLARSFFVADELEWRHFTTTPSLHVPRPYGPSVEDDFGWEAYVADRSVHAQTFAGRVILWRQDAAPPGPPAAIADFTYATTRPPHGAPPGWMFRWHRSERDTTYWYYAQWGHRERTYREAWWRIQDGRWWKVGFAAGAGPGTTWPPWEYGALAFPLWLPMLPLSIAPVVWLYRRRRSTRRAARGCCPACGYDLRASPGACPECGNAVEGSLRAAATKSPPPVRHPAPEGRKNVAHGVSRGFQ